MQLILWARVVCQIQHLHLPMLADATLQAAAAYFLSSSSSDEGEDAKDAHAAPYKAVREPAAGSLSSDTSKQHRRRRHRKRSRDDAGDGHKQACIWTMHCVLCYLRRATPTGMPHLLLQATGRCKGMP